MRKRMHYSTYTQRPKLKLIKPKRRPMPFMPVRRYSEQREREYLSACELRGNNEKVAPSGDYRLRLRRGSPQIGLDNLDFGLSQTVEDGTSFAVGDTVYVVTSNMRVRKTYITGIYYYGPPELGYLYEYTLFDVYFPGPGACSENAVFGSKRNALFALRCYRIDRLERHYHVPLY